MERFVEEPVDYDPFADDPTASAPAPMPPATQTDEPPPPAVLPEVKKGDLEQPAVIPLAPDLPEVIDLNARKKEQDRKQNFKEEPVDYDPFAPEPEKGSLPIEAGKAVAAGATETAGTILKGMGGQRQQEMTDRLAEELRAKWLADHGYTGLTQIGNLPPEKQQELRQGMAAANAQALKQMDLENDVFYRMGVSTNEWSDEKFKAAKDYEDSFTRKLGKGFGSIAPYIAANFVPGVGQVASLEAGYAGAVGSQIDDAVKKGATKEQLLAAMRYGGLGGLTEQLPMEVLFERIPLPALGKVLGAIVKVSATAFAEGGQEAVQQVLQNVVAKYNYNPKQDVMEGVAESALIGALVGGSVAVPHAVIGNDGEERQPKADDVPNVAQPTQPEGTPATPAEAAGTGQPTPGSTGVTAPPPAGVEKQPEGPPGTTDIPGTDPRTETKPPTPAVVPATTPGVTVTQPGQVDPAISTTLGAPSAGAGPSVTTPPVQPAATPEEDEFDVRSTVVEGEEDAAEKAHEARIGEMFARTNAKAAEQTTPAAPNADINAAIVASSPVPQGQQPAQVTTPIIPALAGQGMKNLAEEMGKLGYTDAQIGQLSPEQAAGIVTKGIRAKAQQETLGTGQALGVAQPVTNDIAGEPVTQAPAAATTPVDERQVPATPPLAPELESTPDAAATPALEPASLGEGLIAKHAADRAAKTAEFERVQAEKKAARETKQAENKAAHAAKAEALKQEATARREAKQAAAAEKQAVKAAKAAAVKPAPEAAPVTSTEPAPSVAEVTAPKAELIKAKVATKAEPAAAPSPPPKVAALVARRKKPVVVTREALQERKAAAAPVTAAEAQPAPAAAAEPVSGQSKAVRTPLSKDLADQARRDVIDRSDENTLPPKWHGRADEIAAEVARDNPRPKETSPREHIDALKSKVADRLHGEIQAEAEAELAESERAAEAAEEAEARDESKEREAEKRGTQAAAATGQQRERFTLGKEKSAAGMKVETEKATRRSAEAEEKGLPEAERNPYLAAWLAADREAAAAPANQKAGLIEKRNALQAERIKAAEDTSLKSRATRIERQVKAVAQPTPELPADGTAEDTMKAHFQAFLKATKGIDVTSRVSLRNNSRLENLVIFARKLAGQSDADTVPNGNQFYIVQKMLEAGEHEIFDNEIRSNSGIGSEEIAGEVEADDRTARMSDDIAPEFEAEPLRRGGREGQLTREKAQQARDDRKLKEYDEVTGLHDPSGKPVAAMGTTTTGAAALREVEARARGAEGERGFIPMLRSMLVRHLTNLVGDIEVNFVSAETMGQVEPGAELGTNGFYMDYSDAARAAGKKPRIVLHEEIQWDDVAFNHTVIHEMMHAATSQALRQGIRGVDTILTGMRTALHQQLTDAGLDEATMKAAGIHYAFSNNAEFLAEAFSNPRFQEILAQLTVSPKIRAQIGGLVKGRVPTWWDSFVAAVSHAIGMISGTRGHSYMEQMIKVLPSTTRTSVGQQTAAREELARIKANRPAEKLFDAQPLLAEIDKSARGALAWAGDVKSNLGATLDVRARDKVNTTAGMWREAEQLWGAGTDKFRRYAEVALKKDDLLAKLRKSPGLDQKGQAIDSQGLELETLNYSRAHSAEYKLLGRFLQQATVHGYNPFAPLSDPSNGHISKAGLRSNQARAAHARAQTALKTMPDHMVAMGKKLRQHFIDTRELEAKTHVRELIQNVLAKNRTTLPPGVTLDQAVEWVRSNAARRKPEERDAFDRQMHDHLGRIAATISEVPELMKIPGTYVPMIRRGKYFVSAVEKVFDEAKLPAGATADWAKTDPLEKKNRLMFTDEKALNAFTNSHPDPVKVQTKHVDDQGKKIHHKEPNARKIYFATVQNRHLKMGSFAEMKRHRAAMQAEGHEAAAPRLTGRDLKGAMPQISSPQVMRLLNAVDQTTIGQSEVAKEALKGAILDAHIRTLSSRGHLQRNMKRRNVSGAEDDLFQGLQSYNNSLGNSLANHQMNRELGEAESALRQFMNTDAYNDVGKGADKRSLARQSQVQEVGYRIANFGGYEAETHADKMLSNVRNYTALNKLASPHFALMQVLQNEGQAWPALAAISDAAGRPVGYIKAKGAQWRAMQAFGGMTRNIIKGVKHTGQTAMGTNIGEQDKAFYDAVASHPEARGLTKTFDHMNDFGFGASNANETGNLTSIDQNIATRGLQRTTNAAMSVPTAIERVNRYSTAAAAYELYRSTGMSEDEAAIKAAMKVEEGQLAYGAGNYPRVFRYKWLAPMAQFRKYSLGFGNVYWRTFRRALPYSGHPEARGARRQLAGLTAFTAVFAGLYGQAFIEPLRMITNALFAAGFTDDDWDTKEDKFQVWLAGMFKWATSSRAIGDLLSEATLHGLTRMLNIDASSAMGQDSLAMYKQPHQLDKTGFLAWLAQSFIGASGNMAVDAYNDIGKGAYGDLPIPKILSNLHDALAYYWDGIRNKSTGEKVESTNLYDSAVAMFGLKSAKEAEQWEPGGSGYGNIQLKRAHAKRRDMMKHWRSLGPAGKQNYFQSTIRNYNRTAKEPIQYQDLVRSVKSAAGYKKRVEEYAD